MKNAGKRRTGVVGNGVATFPVLHFFRVVIGAACSTDFRGIARTCRPINRHWFPLSIRLLVRSRGGLRIF